MVYDANTSDNYVLLFSGSGASDDTWTFSNGVWAELSPAIEPPQRTYAAMAYDPLAGYVSCSGATTGPTTTSAIPGSSRATNGPSSPRLLPRPLAPTRPSLRYPPAGGILLFGGNNSEFSHNAGYLGDTWEFTNASNGTWTQVPTGGIDCGGFSQHNCNVTAAPSARATASMTYDARDGYAVLYGGGAANKTSLSDTWTFANGTWTDIAATAGFTKARYYTMMTFDNATADDYVLQFGGINGGDRSINTTWQFLSGSWTNLTELRARSSRLPRSGSEGPWSMTHGTAHRPVRRPEQCQGEQFDPDPPDPGRHLDLPGRGLDEHHSTAYMVTFSESGLLKGMSWNITADDNAVSSNSVFLRFYLPSGTYPYTAAVSGGYAAPIFGNLTVGAKNVEVGVTFSGEKYTASFTESHLPKNTAWSVTIFGQQVSSSNDGTIKFQSTNALFNGTYTYLIGIVPGYRTTEQANLTVDGANIAVLVNFVPFLYTVTFSESGLPAHTTWKVTLKNASTSVSNSSTANYENFSEPNGTFSFSIGIVPGYSTTDSGTVVVNAANTSVSVTFGVTEFSITFVEEGLPTTDQWYVNITGGPDLVGSGSISQVSTALANGTYAFTVATNDPTHAVAYTPSLKVKGAALSVGLSFAPYTYQVTFKETGLPSGTNWSVTANSLTAFSTTNSIPFRETNGTYDYTADGSAVAPLHGPRRTPHRDHDILQDYLHGVGVGEGHDLAGHPGRGRVKVCPRHRSSSTSRTGTTVTRSVWSQATTRRTSGTVMVKSAPVTVSPSFLKTTYTVKFAETGLPSGANWYVVFDGSNKSSTASSISFTGTA